MKANEVYTTEQTLNPAMGFNMTMNRYICKDGSEAVMHNNKTHVKTADGRDWTLASTIVTVANAGIPAATTEPTKVIAPTAPAAPIAPTTPKK